MNDKELADRIVAVGVGYLAPVDLYGIPLAASERATAKRFVRDWRVAGALMERVMDATKDRNKAWAMINPQGAWISWMVQPISLPRAIIEACVSALTGQKT